MFTVNEHDRNLLLLISLLTVGSLLTILTVAGLTAWTVNGSLVFMVMGWFFGAILAWGYTKYQQNHVS